MRYKILFLAVFIFSRDVAVSGSAAFLTDGKRVVRTEDRTLLVRSLEEEGKEIAVGVPSELTGTDLSIARRTDGSMAVVGDHKAMLWNPDSGKWQPLCDAPEGSTFEDIAVDPKSGNMVFALYSAEKEWEWKVLRPGSTELLRVFNRRASGAAYPVFDANGVLYFAREGDVWKGRIDYAPEMNWFVLSGTRIWPLGEHETSDANNSGVGAQGIAPMTTHLLINRSRMGGSGWGRLVRVPNADAYEGKLPLRWEELDDTEGGGVSLAISPDGNRAAVYISVAKRWFVLEKPEGELVPLSR